MAFDFLNHYPTYLLKIFFSVSLFFHGLFYAKATLRERQQCYYYLIHTLRDKEYHTFPKGIRPKVNAITRLEFERTYYNVTVWHVSYPTTEIPTHWIYRVPPNRKKYNVIGIVTNTCFITTTMLQSRTLPTKPQGLPSFYFSNLINIIFT